MLCCVEFSEDGEMYRCKVAGVEENIAEVEYIDYGNTEEVDVKNILELPQQFQSLEPAGVAVQVRGASLAMDTEKGRKKLESLLGGDKVCLLVENTFTVKLDEKKKGKNKKGKRERFENGSEIGGGSRVEVT